MKAPFEWDHFRSTVQEYAPVEALAGGLSQIIQAPEVLPVEGRRRLHFDSDDLATHPIYEGVLY